MIGYQKPTEKGASKEVISFWGELWRPNPPNPETGDKGNVHGEALVSPKFGTQSDLTGWIRAHRKEGDEIFQWKRISRPEAGAFDDIALMVEDVLPDKARVVALVEELKAMLEAKKKDLDRPFPKRESMKLSGNFDALTPMLTYDEVYDAQGELLPPLCPLGLCDGTGWIDANGAARRCEHV